MRGDEHDNFLATCNSRELRNDDAEDNLFAARAQNDEDDDGDYTVLRDHAGWYVFADKRTDGNIYPTQFRVDRQMPRSLGFKRKSILTRNSFLKTYSDDDDRPKTFKAC